ncbi:DNA repair protein rhp57 [Teratosphaeria destructans]|uniref:DNA repair protein rhp57 n=1 Tax=Teratosphaeria destructans TaxID=418781 RepID=A0A9W7W7I7_9PEZI|nr:DNA repair protein rhp57 [Teratosphaeria destructans]
MTSLLTVLPDFDIKPFTHILPSLEKASISTADLLTLDAVDVAKRAQVPPGEVKKLASALASGLHGCLDGGSSGAGTGQSSFVAFQHGYDLIKRWQSISTLDHDFDASLGGGIASEHVTEFVGESAAGKTQFLLTLLLSVQLPSPLGFGRSALYVSTEAPLQTTRLTQILKAHPRLAGLESGDKPSLSRIHSTHIHDLEAQEHIIRYQVPVVIERHDIGLLVIDSIAANYRPEFDRGKARKSAIESFAKRSKQVAELGALLRGIARTHNVAVVVANQVADRFLPVVEPLSQVPSISQQTQRSRPASPPPSLAGKNSVIASQAQPNTDLTSTPTLLSTDDPLALDHQHNFFTGWGDDLSLQNLKTPSLGLTWTSQLGARIALLRAPVTAPDGSVRIWRRTFKVVFSAWGPESSTAFEITEGGVRAVKDALEEQ